MKVWSLILPLAFACSDTEEAAAPPVEDKCPRVDPDHMAGRWIHVQGTKGDPHLRFELLAQGDSYEMWYVNGFTKRTLKGERRANDFMFTEVPSARMRALYDKGEASLVRLYVEPRKSQCALRVSQMTISLDDGREVEHPKPGFQEFLEFPEGTEMTFHPCDEELFLGAAAKDHKVAMDQVARLGSADPEAQLDEAIPVGTWSEAAKDGAASCTFDMDLYFDGAPVKGRQGLPVEPAKGELRHWYVADWYSPYSGNHDFEIYRYRTCGGERELIAVACMEAALHP